MRLLFIFLAVLPFIANSQNNSFEIYLNSDSTIKTNKLELVTNSFLKAPHIIINEANPTKINLDKIEFYEGFDSNGVFKSCNVINLNFQNQYHFTERIFSKEKLSEVELFYTKLTFGKWNFSKSYKSYKYKIGSNVIKKINYYNLKSDFSKNSEGYNYFKKGNKYRVLQIISTSLGVILASKVILDVHEDSFYSKKDTQTNILYATSGLLIITPLVFEIPKRKNYIRALKKY
jgi:hypothetical protein